MSTEALAHPADIAFVASLLTLSGLAEMPADAMTVEAGRIVELQLKKPFKKLTSFPSFAGLLLRKLVIDESTAAEKDRWKAKALRYDGPSSLTHFEVSLKRLVTLEIPALHTDVLDLSTPALKTFSGKVHVQKRVELHTPITIPLTTSTELSWVQLSGSGVQPIDLQAQRKLTKLDVRQDHAVSLDLADHPLLTSLHIEGAGRIEVRGNFTQLAYAFVGGNVTPETLHRFAETRNWDESTTMIRLEFILRNANCAEQTANLVYWLANPTWYLQYADDDEVPQEEQKPLRLIRLIEEMVAEGRVWATAEIPPFVAEDLNPDVKRVRALPEHFAAQLKR